MGELMSLRRSNRPGRMSTVHGRSIRAKRPSIYESHLSRSLWLYIYNAHGLTSPSLFFVQHSRLTPSTRYTTLVHGITGRRLASPASHTCISPYRHGLFL